MVARFTSLHVSHVGLVVVLLTLLLGCGDPPPPPLDLDAVSWETIESRAGGQTVTMMMWMGDPYVNRYMRDYVAPTLKERHNLNIQFSAGQGSEVVALLMTEREASKASSEIDMMWINGETFYQLRAIEALYGPFTDALPNIRFVDLENPFIGIDFQQPIDGYEAPWGNVQFAMIYDTSRVDSPPQTPDELAGWVREHPDRFTFDTSFAGMTFLKGLLVHFAGGPGALNGPYDPEAYAEASDSLWSYINTIKPYFWKSGETFPQNVAQVHQLFASGEVDFTMSNNDGEVDNKVLQGLFPKTARAYVLETGTIQNSHYLGIPYNAVNKEGALVAINFLLSPEAQLEKMKPTVWGDGTVLDRDRLPEPMQAAFDSVAVRTYAPPREAIETYALRELDPEYMIRLYEDFRTYVLNAS